MTLEKAHLQERRQEKDGDRQLRHVNSEMGSYSGTSSKLQKNLFFSSNIRKTNADILTAVGKKVGVKK